jgi:FHA domain-containing protein
LILRVYDTTPAREFIAPAGTCSIGRGEDNDLVINQAGVSRRHAVIGVYSDGAQISDCGSQNGTFVNHRPVVGSAPINNGDTISLGSVCEIEVVMTASKAKDRSEAPSGAARALGEEAPLPARSRDHAGSGAGVPRRPRLTAPLGAVFSIIGIVVIASVIAWMKSGNGELDEKKIVPSPGPSTPASPSLTASRPPEDRAFIEIEGGAKRMMRRISNDSMDYASLDQSSLRQIRSAVEQSCKSPSLAAAFQVIGQNRGEFIRLADNQISPDLLAYAVLAETNGGTQNLMAKAREMAPKLNALRSMFGGDLTDSALLFVAAYYEGFPSKKHHPLLDRIPDPTQRDIWSLSRGGKFKPGQYEFVLRFIAYGIIADNPRQCGIALPRLDFWTPRPK